MAANYSNRNQSPGSGRTGLMFAAGAIAMAALFVVGFLPQLSQQKRLSQEVKSSATALRKVVYTAPHPAPNSDLTLPGTTQAIEDTVIGSRTTGYVVKRYVDIGSRVKTGQLLAEIDSPDVDQQMVQADAQTAQTNAQVGQARADVVNKQATVSQSQATVSQTEAALEQANAQTADAEAKLEQLRAAKLVADAQLLQARRQVDMKKAALAQAVTTRDFNVTTAKRYNSLFKQGFVAAQDNDQARSAADTAIAAVNSAKADLAASDANVAASEQLVKSSEANINSGEAELKAAEKNVKAVEATIRSAQSAVKAAQANVYESRSNVTAAVSAVHANQANGKRFQVLMGFEKVTAPFDGVITARNVEVGNLINAGGGAAGGGSSPVTAASSSGNVSNVGSAATAAATPNSTPSGGLFGLARTDIMRILVSVPQAYSRELRNGMKAHVVFSREFPGRTFEGTVSAMSGAIDVTSRTLLVEVHIDNRDGALLPGMYGLVHFDLRRPANAWRVPSGAVVFDSLGTRIATINADDHVHYVPVKIGADYGAEVEVVSGLTGKERIAAAPADDLGEDEAIKPIEPQSPPKGAPGSH